MSLIGLVITILIIAGVLWLVNRSQADATIKTIIWWVCIISIILLVLYAFGIWDKAKSITVPHL